MIRKCLLIALVGATILPSACEHNPTAPELVPGRRDYIWQLDTLDMPMNYIAAVWGASPNDVWAVGAGGTYRDRLLHYDGKTWSTYDKEPIWCTGNTLFGFAANDVWMGGGAGWLAHGAGIWHYDGVEWSQHYVYNIPGSYSMHVQDIWGTAPNDVYASGLISFYDGQTDDFRGFVLHFDGRRWQEVIKVGPFNSQFLRIRKEGDRLYVQSFRNGIISNSTDTYVFYEIEGEELREIYSARNGAFNHIDGKIYFVIGDDVHRYLDGSLVKQFSIANENFGKQIYGRNAMDMFLRMKDGLAHFDGMNIEYLYDFSKNSISLNANAVLFAEEVFFCALSKDFKNLILHGMLDE